MSKTKKLLAKVLTGSSDSNISFSELCKLLENLGFEKRTKGSHTIFRKEGVEEKINLQKDGSKAKAYQVKQIREIIANNNLAEELESDESDV
ncbi:MAG: type II toxin-antitoxin system HicA family toxin [Planctomycetes bacterium]|nr:type II toxin-antitoxin system HicA family toxin [Planctomycetota bacterium]